MCAEVILLLLRACARLCSVICRVHVRSVVCRLSFVPRCGRGYRSSRVLYSRRATVVVVSSAPVEGGRGEVGVVWRARGRGGGAIILKFSLATRRVDGQMHPPFVKKQTLFAPSETFPTA